MNTTNMWQQIIDSGSYFEQSMDKLFRKQTGSYYTALELTRIMMQQLVNSFDAKSTQNLYEKRFLEPCVGTGNFVFAYLEVCSKLSFTREQYLQLLDNIYVCDVNVQALSIYKINLMIVCKELFDIQLDDSYFDKHIGSSLLFDLTSQKPRYISLNEAFDNRLSFSKFDIVVTNPPYKNLKAERSHYQSEEEYIKDKEIYALINDMAMQKYPLSSTGTLNIYKLFVEEIINHYLVEDGKCSLLIPASILSDKTCTKLRTHIIENCDIKSIGIIAENSDYIDASQALCSLVIHKGCQTKNIMINGSYNKVESNLRMVDVNDVVDKNAGNSILVLTENEYSIRKQMCNHPRIKEIPYIVNLRGELDLTMFRTSITLESTNYRLIRGRNISKYRLLSSEPEEFVDEVFVETCTKKKYIPIQRLVCQQVVNVAKKNRVSFAIVPSNVVIANSCNFLALNENEDGVDIYFLLGVLNSPLIDWFFKQSSSNNHISNYEIDSFPIPIHCDEKIEISNLVRTYLYNSSEELLDRINAMVSKAYGIYTDIEQDENSLVTIENMQPNTKNQLEDSLFYSLGNILTGISKLESDDILNGNASVLDVGFQKNPNISSFDRKVVHQIEHKHRKLSKGIVLNHTTSKLSDLDMEMIRFIPQGGNWKNIPKETVAKSQRLIRINETGGRTTLYGRIDYSKPSYTITTYFNRPGNGAYVHPILDRVISVREAARFQSFPDNFYFSGSKSDLLNQVGNAVPVLLAYQIGNKIKELINCSVSVDLFSGAGGMTYGFKCAGIRSAVCNDIDESACISLKINIPESPIICGDITKYEIKNAIIDMGIKDKADIICGGPPCQGFSMAGFRAKDDPRNQLFRDFVDIVTRVNPKVIVFENVVGLVSYQGGLTYHNIIQLFSEIGYKAEGRILQAQHYGVPQKRKRVIIICIRNDMPFVPGDLFPLPITPHEDMQISAFDTISDLEKIECSENAEYIETQFESVYLKYLKGHISISEYVSMMYHQSSHYEPIVSRTLLGDTHNNQLPLFDS